MCLIFRHAWINLNAGNWWKVTDSEQLGMVVSLILGNHLWLQIRMDSAAACLCYANIKSRNHMILKKITELVQNIFLTLSLNSFMIILCLQSPWNSWTSWLLGFNQNISDGALTGFIHLQWRKTHSSVGSSHCPVLWDSVSHLQSTWDTLHSTYLSVFMFHMLPDP